MPKRKKIMAKINSSFVAAVAKSVFNSNTWNPVGEPISLKEAWNAAFPGLYEKIDGDTATVVAVTFDSGDTALRISVPIKGEEDIQLKLSSKSDLEEDDVVAIASITGQLLRKAGYDDIIKYDGVLDEDWDGEEEPEDEEEEEDEEPAPKTKSKAKAKSKKK